MIQGRGGGAIALPFLLVIYGGETFLGIKKRSHIRGRAFLVNFLPILARLTTIGREKTIILGQRPGKREKRGKNGIRGKRGKKRSQCTKKCS
jgi:hypothetical protein